LEQIELSNNIEYSKDFIGRENELSFISKGLTDFNYVFIVGDAGVGKTALVRHFAISHQHKFKKILFIKGFELEYNPTTLALIKKPLDRDVDLIIIDGFDDIMSTDIKNQVLSLAMELKKYLTKLIITSRPFYNENAQRYGYKLKLNSLNIKEASLFIKTWLERNNLPHDFINSYTEFSENLDNSPLAMNLALQLLIDKQLTYQELINLVNNRLIYKNQLIYTNPNDKIITSNHEIIRDITVVNTKLLDKINFDPKLMYSLSPRQFEEFVAELFEKDGYSVTLTPQTRDGGKDLFIAESKLIGNFIYYIECKKYSPNYPVGVRAIRELHGAVSADKATAGIVVTSSYFSRPAKEFTEKIKNQMSLIDFSNLKKWIDKTKN